MNVYLSKYKSANRLYSTLVTPNIFMIFFSLKLFAKPAANKNKTKTDKRIEYARVVIKINDLSKLKTVPNSPTKKKANRNPTIIFLGFMSFASLSLEKYLYANLIHLAGRYVLYAARKSSFVMFLKSAIII